MIAMSEPRITDLDPDYDWRKVGHTAAGRQGWIACPDERPEGPCRWFWCVTGPGFRYSRRGTAFVFPALTHPMAIEEVIRLMQIWHG
jgi:hypothetical protein